jgi:HK97 family phage major capsid protein
VLAFTRTRLPAARKNRLPRACPRTTSQHPKRKQIMTIAQLQEKRNKLFADASAIVAGESVTAEQRTQFDTMLAEVTVVDGDIVRLKAIDEHRASLRNPVDQPAPKPGESADPEERAEVRMARVTKELRNYMLTGKRESRDLTSAAEGVAIPVGFNPQVISAQKSYGQLYDIVTMLKTDNGEPIKMVMDNDTSNGLVAVTVGTAASEVDPTIAGVTLNVGNYTTGVVKVDRGLLSDAGFNIADWIEQKFLNRFYRGASSLIYSGDSGAVASLATGYNTADTVTSATTNILAYKDFAAVIAALDPAYALNAVFAMSNATLGYVVGLSDSAGRPLFLPNYGDASSGFAGTILGKNVKVVTQMPAVATAAVPVLYGDFREAYTFRQQNPGIGILRLNELYAAGFEVGFVGFARVGGVNTDAGTHPVCSITIR